MINSDLKCLQEIGRSNFTVRPGDARWPKRQINRLFKDGYLMYWTQHNSYTLSPKALAEIEAQSLKDSFK